jgi:hypothetical protein
MRRDDEGGSVPPSRSARYRQERPMSDLPRHSFIRVAAGESFPVDDPVAWCLEHACDPLLERARDRLLQCDCRTDPQRVLNVIFRRCGLNLAEVRPDRLVVHHWTALADIRPFCKSQRLARHDVRVALVRHRNGLVTVQPGDDFLYGERLGWFFRLDAYRERWQRRHERQADDCKPSPCGRSSYSWEGLGEGRIPWSALKSIWRREERSRPCPNCELPLAAWAFSWRHRTLLSMHGFVARCCLACRRDFVEDTGDLWPWLAATLDADVLPAWNDDGLHRTDLRPRWPATPTRNLYDLNNLPPDLTLDELVRILM